MTCGAMWFETSREDLDFVLCLLVHSRHSLSRCETAHDAGQAAALEYEGFITISESIDHLDLEADTSPRVGGTLLALLVMALAPGFDPHAGIHPQDPGSCHHC